MTAMNTEVGTAVTIEIAAVWNMTPYKWYRFPTSRRIVLLLENGCYAMHRALQRPWFSTKLNGVTSQKLVTVAMKTVLSG